MSKADKRAAQRRLDALKGNPAPPPIITTTDSKLPGKHNGGGYVKTRAKIGGRRPRFSH